MTEFYSKFPNWIKIWILRESSHKLRDFFYLKIWKIIKMWYYIVAFKKRKHAKKCTILVFLWLSSRTLWLSIVVGLSANDNEDINISSLWLAYYLLVINSMSSLERETSSGLICLQLSLSIKSGYNFLVKL